MAAKVCMVHRPIPLAVVSFPAFSTAILLLQALVEHGSTRSFDEYMIAQSMRLLEDQEVRVRLAVGDVLKALASKLGITVYEQTHEAVLKSIHDHFVSLAYLAQYCTCPSAKEPKITRLPPWIHGYGAFPSLCQADGSPLPLVGPASNSSSHFCCTAQTITGSGRHARCRGRSLVYLHEAVSGLI